MHREVIVSSLPGELRAALVCDGELEDLLVLRDGAGPEAGDVLEARVQRFDKGLDGAFVDLGLERPGLLPRRETPEGRIPPEGSRLTVRVLRAPAGDKGARVSAKGVTEGEGAGPLAAFWRRAAPQRLVCDDAGLLQQLKSHLAEDAAAELHSAAQPLFESASLENEIEALLAPRVELPGGGFLLIEPVETLTAIDVNAGRRDGRGGAAALAREVNLAALPVIARQLRLRNLSGLIVIDFLEMKQAADRKAVAAALRQAVKPDPEPCQVFGVSPSGLLEMTRRRGRPPLHEILLRPCGLAGSGRAKQPATLAYEALRHALSGALGQAAAEVTLRVAPEVAAALAGAQAAALAAVERRLGRKLQVTADPLVSGYELMLG